VAIKVKIPKGKRGRSRLANPIVRASVAAFIIVCTLMLGVYAYFYIHYQKLIDQRMAGPVFANTSKIYATPRTLFIGYKGTPQEIATYLRKSGYTEADERTGVRMGTYKLVSHSVDIKPGPESFHDSEGARIEFSDGEVSKIVSYDKGTNIGAYELEPQLVTGLFQGEQRSKRRLVTYDEIPTNLVHAVLAIEDRKFFEHSGINYLRFGQAAFRNLVSGHKGEGGSTLTMQIARGFFLTPEKTITRKAAEMMIATELEQRYSKKQIFEFYANHVNMGQRGSFSIDGLGEAAQAYFAKDIKTLNLQESALLAALIQRPNYLSPYKHPERAMARRNLVLEGMVDTGAINREQADAAKASPLKLAPFNVESSDAPYFVDLVKEQLLSQYSEEQLNEDGLRIYTTIDPDLQAAAAQAVDIGIKDIDELVKKNRTRKIKVGKGKAAKTETKVLEGPPAQVALVALNPQTGEVLALVGGRNYGWSQLNHAVAKRPTGSIFKPFVFASAVNNALDKPGEPVFTAVTPVDNTPTTFFYEDKTYEPRNYGDKYNEVVTARFALAHSLNNATVRIAEAVGYEKVADLARQAGIASVRATPALALGSYDATPLDMAGAYTVFANAGVRVNPIMITSVRDAKGEVVQNFTTTKKPVLDPRVAYVITNMLEGVINNGTAAGVRARGFSAPAAGKTGTSHDAWFAGYTSNLLCIVWVGLDDYTDIKIEGAKSAAPIWAEFMKRAVQLEEYKNPKPFTPPDGVIKLNIDKITNRVATASCPDDFDAAFIAGTEPTETCDQSPVGSFFSRVFGLNPQPKQADLVSNDAHQQAASGSGNPAAPEKPKEKKGFFGKIFGVFKGDDKDKKSQNQGNTDQHSKDTPPRPQ
jgi:penicillin-binding protein 1B